MRLNMTVSSKEVQDDHVVAMHYVLRNGDGNVIDQSDEGSPLSYLHGHKNIVPGLERALTGMKVGEKKEVIVSPEEGYGVKEPEMVLEVPRDQLPPELDPKVGMTISMETDSGHTVPVRISEVSPDHVKLDANHELAGVTLHFAVTIGDVRKATSEELSHGHVHDGHGHHH